MKQLILGIFFLIIYLNNGFADASLKANASMVNASAPLVIAKTNSSSAANNLDRFESFNRWSFALNSRMDKHVLRPVTVWYITYIPHPIRYAIGNFYNNLRDFVSLGNDVLQLNGMSTMHTMMRVSINSTFGMVGLIDISSSLGLPEEKNSFGKTMRVYGWKQSSYIVIPFLGPSTVRDALGTIPDVYFNPTWYFVSDYVSIVLYVVNSIDTRAKFIGPDKILETTSLDPYISMRDFYLQSIGEVVPTKSSVNSDMNINMFLDDSDVESMPVKKGAASAATSSPSIERNEELPERIESGHISDIESSVKPTAPESTSGMPAKL